MCCALDTSVFTTTIAPAWVVSPKLHAMGYQNTAQNLAAGGNAMLLPIPARPGTLSKTSLLDTRSCKDVLETMKLFALWNEQQNFGADSMGRGAKGAEPVVFDFDVYSIVLATNAADIPSVLDQVSPEKRPPLKKSIFNSYGRWYQDWYMLLCCFNNADLKKAAPLVVVYEPINPKKLFVPGLDAHDGKAPKLRGKVATDHAVMVGHYAMEPGTATPVLYNDVPAEVLQYLPKQVMGRSFNTPQDQGDWVFDTDAVAAGKFEPRRELPPGAKKKSA